MQAVEDYFEAPDEKHPLRVTFEALAEEFIKRLPHVCRSPDDRKRRGAGRGRCAVTVGDFQKYLRALADAVNAKTPAKELTDAADALAPFAGYKMEQFAKFLAAAEAKYGATGELPDPTPKKEPTPPKQPKPPRLTASDLSAKIVDVKRRLESREPLDRAALEAELKPFEALSEKAIKDVMVGGLKFPRQVKPKPKALEAIVNHILAPHTASDRAGV